MGTMMDEEREWLVRMAEAEDGCVVSAGGWVSRLSQAQRATPEAVYPSPKPALGRLLKLIRRHQRLTLDQLARQLDIDPRELRRLEREANYRPTPLTLLRLTRYLFEADPDQVGRPEDADPCAEAGSVVTLDSPRKLKQEALDVLVAYIEELQLHEHRSRRGA